LSLAGKANDAIIRAFTKSGWAEYNKWVSYDAISYVVNRKIDYSLKRRTIERSCRDLARRGILQSDRKGNFRWGA